MFIEYNPNPTGRRVEDCARCYGYYLFPKEEVDKHKEGAERWVILCS